MEQTVNTTNFNPLGPSRARRDSELYNQDLIFLFQLCKILVEGIRSTHTTPPRAHTQTNTYSTNQPWLYWLFTCSFYHSFSHPDDDDEIPLNPDDCAAEDKHNIPSSGAALHLHIHCAHVFDFIRCSKQNKIPELLSSLAAVVVVVVVMVIVALRRCSRSG